MKDQRNPSAVILQRGAISGEDFELNKDNEGTMMGGNQQLYLSQETIPQTRNTNQINSPTDLIQIETAEFNL